MFKRSLLGVLLVSALAGQSVYADADVPSTGVLRKVCASSQVNFVKNMVNPCAYKDALVAMWQAGFKGALPELFAHHKAVIAGTAVFAALIAYAHKQGLFADAKEYLISKKEAFLNPQS